MLPRAKNFDGMQPKVNCSVTLFALYHKRKRLKNE